MTKKRFTSLAGFAVALGATGGFFLAPAIHRHDDPRGRLHPMWAHYYASLGEMAGDADAVVLATVTGTRPGRTMLTSGGESVLPFTLVDLEVNQSIRGDVEKNITVEQTGGEADGVAYYIDGDGGPYDVGGQVLLFLKAQPDTEMYYVSHPAGRFGVRGNTLQATAADHPAAQGLDRASIPGAIRMIEHAASQAPVD